MVSCVCGYLGSMTSSRLRFEHFLHVPHLMTLLCPSSPCSHSQFNPSSWHLLQKAWLPGTPHRTSLTGEQLRGAGCTCNKGLVEFEPTPIRFLSPSSFSLTHCLRTEKSILSSFSNRFDTFIAKIIQTMQENAKQESKNYSNAHHTEVNT